MNNNFVKYPKNIFYHLQHKTYLYYIGQAI